MILILFSPPFASLFFRLHLHHHRNHLFVTNSLFSLFSLNALNPDCRSIFLKQRFSLSFFGQKNSIPSHHLTIFSARTTHPFNKVHAHALKRDVVIIVTARSSLCTWGKSLSSRHHLLLNYYSLLLLRPVRCSWTTTFIRRKWCPRWRRRRRISPLDEERFFRWNNNNNNTKKDRSV